MGKRLQPWLELETLHIIAKLGMGEPCAKLICLEVQVLVQSKAIQAISLQFIGLR